MTQPISLSLSSQKLLLKKVGSRFSDNWFLACHFKPTNIIINSFISSILDWISFYFIGDAAIFLLLTLPIIFFFQASGKQRKMAKLYSRSRLHIICFLFTCSFAYMLSPVVGWIFRQSGPCTQAVKGAFVHLGSLYQLPSYNVVLATIMCAFVFKAKLKENILAIDDDASKIKQFFSYFFDHLLMKTIGVVVLFLFSMIESFYGRANILQICFSISFGVLIDAFVSLCPIIISLILAFLALIVGIIEIILYKTPAQVPEINDDLRNILLSGFGFEIYACFLLGAFIYSRPTFSIYSHFYSFLEDVKVDNEDDAAAFGEFESETDEVSQDLKEILISDLKFSAYGTILHICCQVLQEIITTT